MKLLDLQDYLTVTETPKCPVIRMACTIIHLICKYPSDGSDAFENPIYPCRGISCGECRANGYAKGKEI